jgi:hypothetical protein
MCTPLFYRPHIISLQWILNKVLIDIPSLIGKLVGDGASTEWADAPRYQKNPICIFEP